MGCESSYQIRILSNQINRQIIRLYSSKVVQQCVHGSLRRWLRMLRTPIPHWGEGMEHAQGMIKKKLILDLKLVLQMVSLILELV